MDVATCRPEDLPDLRSFLGERHAVRVARRGVLVDALDHPALLAWSAGELVGAASYAIDGDSCELLTLYAAAQHNGTGSELLTGVQEAARAAGCTRLWVVTTNDNVDALRFYQRRGLRLAVLRPRAVDLSRENLKPEIPERGAYNIPLRDELELEMSL